MPEQERQLMLPMEPEIPAPLAEEVERELVHALARLLSQVIDAEREEGGSDE